MSRSMMRRLLSSAAVVSICAVGPSLRAQTTTISSAQTTPEQTSSAGNIVISSSGSITLPGTTAPGTAAVLINSPNNTVDNEGSITINNANGVAGILAEGGLGGASSITVGGSISLTDNPAATHLPLTNGLYRFGIWVNGNANSPFNGSIDQTAGTIAVRGNQSAAIYVGPGGITGQNSSGTAYGITQASGAAIGITASNFVTGTYAPTGNYSYGLLTRGYIQGSISLAGTVTAVGAGAIGVSIQNSVGGGISIDGAETADGYYNGGVVTSRPSPYPTNLTAGNFLQSGPVVAIGYFPTTGAGSFPTDVTVGGGLTIGSSGTLISYGSSPALLIDAASGHTTTINPPSGSTTQGIVIDGAITANGIYDQKSATGIQIGGSGGKIAINQGIELTGSVIAAAFATGANGYGATAISFQNFQNATTQNGAVTGMSLTNTGTIKAYVNYGAGANSTVGGNAAGIVDTAGALSSITNEGTIKVTTVAGYNANAIDLSGSSAGVTITQVANTSTSATITTPSINGDILFGSGSSTLNLGAGTITGNVKFLNSGSSSVNAVTVDGGAQLNGNVIFSAGTNNLNIGTPVTGATAGFMTGSLAESGGTLGVTVDNGILTDTNLNKISLSSLTLGSSSGSGSGQLVLGFDPANKTNPLGGFDVTGAMIVYNNAKLGLDFQSKLVSSTNENFTIINAVGGISNGNGGTPSLVLGEVPYFYVANFQTTGNAINLSIRDRTFAEAGVAGNAAAYQAIFGAYDRDPGVFNTFNTASTQQAFRSVYNQELPNYTGGLFELLSNGADAITRAEANSPIALHGDSSGGWAQQLGFGAYRNNSSAPGYHGGGLGFAFGYEEPASTISAIGYTVAYLRGSIDPAMAGSGDRQVGSIYSAGVYWREVDGPFHANASLNVGYAALNSQRNFDGVNSDGSTFSRQASSAWSGGMADVHIGVDYEQPLGDGYYIRPSLAGDYFMLYEDSHGDHNGGSAFDLNYASNFGKQGSGTAAVSFGMKIGEGDEFIWRPEVTAGWRQVFGGPDNVTAQFASGGSSFSLTPPSQKGGALARLGVHGGDESTDIAFEAGGEERGSYRAFDGQLVARFGF